MNKKGAIGEWMITIYRLLIVTVLAVTILTFSSIFYNYHVDIRNSEAIIMTKQLVNCIAPTGILETETLTEETKEGILNYCIKTGDLQDRFYLKIIVTDELEKEVYHQEEGDPGALWVRKLFTEVTGDTSTIKKYRPGYSEMSFPVYVQQEKQGIKGNLTIEVLIKDAE